MVVLLVFFFFFFLLSCFCLFGIVFIICLGLCFFIYFFPLFSNHAMKLTGSWFPRQELGLGLQGGSTESKILECWRIP